MEVVKLDGLPKVSLNKWYAGTHWTKRQSVKKQTAALIPPEFHGRYGDGKYDVEYRFQFKSRPLDASNCVAMVKIIEDILFVRDAYNCVRSVRLTSDKGDKDTVSIIIRKIKK